MAGTEKLEDDFMSSISGYNGGQISGNKDVLSEIEMLSERSDNRGREPLPDDRLRKNIRDELTRMFLKIEKTAFEELPEKGSDVKQHVINAIAIIADKYR